MRNTSRLLHPLFIFLALLFIMGANENCQPVELAEDPGEGAIDAPTNQWTWVNVDGAVCADGSPTGIGVNPGSSDVLFVYLQGGGACWDHDSCYQNPSASNLSGFGLEEFRSSQLFLSLGPFLRADAQNPLRDANMVFVPYCTGDVHAGDAVTDHGGIATHHRGYANMGLALERIRATFPDARQVILSGASAGGIGALVNGERTQQVFGDVPVNIISDSGILLPNPYTPEPLEQAWRSSWNLAATLPPGCSGCETDLTAIYGHLAASNPSSRIGLISYTQDNVIPLFLEINEAEYEEGLYTMGPTMDSYGNLNFFVDTGVGHVLWTIGWHSKVAGGVTLSEWTRQIVEDDSAWGSAIGE